MCLRVSHVSTCLCTHMSAIYVFLCLCVHELCVRVYVCSCPCAAMYALACIHVCCVCTAFMSVLYPVSLRVCVLCVHAYVCLRCPRESTERVREACVSSSPAVSRRKRSLPYRRARKSPLLVLAGCRRRVSAIFFLFILWSAHAMPTSNRTSCFTGFCLWLFGSADSPFCCYTVIDA